MTTAPLPPPDYATWLHDVKACIQAARIAVARAANRELILLYWDLGRGIVEKQEGMGWGKSVVVTLAADLREAYPGVMGFSANNLWLMRQFYTEYSAPGFLEQCVQDVLAPVPWGHHVEIVYEVKGLGLDQRYDEDPFWSASMASSAQQPTSKPDLSTLNHEGIITRVLDDGYAYVDESGPNRRRFIVSFSRSVPNYRGETARELRLTRGARVRFSSNGNEIQRIAVGPDYEGFLNSR